MIEETAGDSFAASIDIIDADSGLIIPAANVSQAWVEIGPYSFTLASIEVTIADGLLKLRLTPEQTKDLKGYYLTHAKVALVDGRHATLLRDEYVRFYPSTLSENIHV